ncbi:nucleotidyltransferase domain-containing protein [Candidatus Woesearchaeota archaeon]|nr:nucleotidyltransferase domain-containing protein [Candidatus Woesearchaeota archaeon]
MNIILKHLKQLGLFKKTKFVILYGSVAQGKATPLSDIDVCISLALPPAQRFKARVKLLGELPEKYDIHIFEDLPLYVQKEVFAGKILYCQNKDELVQRALVLIREYEDFEPIYEYYISQRGAEAIS